ncbi:MAG TPA: hypothetical protein VM286_09035 [Candidatus Thermoplasmatota archaeon]|nr:hypothetical protein [Candidatus Thermoplasmatota archaeon]
MRILPSLCITALLLAGCTGKVPDNLGVTTLTPEMPAMNATTVKAHVPVAKAVNLTADGMLARTVGGCIFVPTPQCQFQSTGTDKSEFDLEMKGNLTGLVATITWTAATPATDTLALSAALFPCDGCPGHGTFLGEATGTSPLKLTIPASTPAVQLNATNRLHFFVYNSKGAVFNEQVPGHAYVTDEQAFKIDAVANLLD